MHGLAAALALLPDLLLIALGGVVGRLMGPDLWPALDRLNYNVLFPALLFVAGAARPIPLSEVASTGLAVWAILLLGLLLAWPLRPLGPPRFLDFAGCWQTAWRFNAALALAAATALPGAVGARMPVAVGLAVPLANVLAVAALSRGHGLGRGLLSVAGNPFLLASLGGLAVGLSGWTPPALPLAVLGRLSEAAVPLALLSVGASVDWRAPLRLSRFTAGLNAVKLLALPLAAWAAARALRLPPDLAALAVVFAALPTATAAHVLAAGFGADRAAVAGISAQSTLFACLNFPLWTALALA